MWVLADPPHIVKRLRNNLLDSGIRTSQGGLLNKALMEEMVAINGTSAEYRVAHKVHLTTHVQVCICTHLLNPRSAEIFSLMGLGYVEEYFLFVVEYPLWRLNG